MLEPAFSLESVPQRIAVQGASGSGKTTLAKEVATTLGIPRLELDSIYHLENWTPLDEDSFRETVRSFASGPQWVTDGNYRVVRDLVWDRADLVVIIHLAKWRVMSRIIRRTIRRAVHQEELWNGNREGLRNLASLKPERNIVLWSWNTHHKYKEIVPNEAREQAKSAQVIVLRSPRDVANFVEQLKILKSDVDV
jgi:adenylate kinase family enzyme